MRAFVASIAAIWISFFGVAAQSSVCDGQCQQSLIEQYFSSLAKVYRADSEKQDIDRLFELFDPQAQYQHIEYGADFDYDAWKTAFISNLERGAYSAGPRDSIRVEDAIYGKTHVAVEYSYGEMTEAGVWQPKGDQKLLAVFGFTGDKISLVREYW